MDLLRILDAKPEPQIVDTNHFNVDPIYQNSNVYKIATPMSDFQKELIDQIVSLHYSDILRFFEKLDNESWENISNNRKEIIKTSLETLLENAKFVCLHPYLLINHFFPKSLTTRDLPSRLAETSGKFQILNNILSQLDSIYNPIDKHDKSMRGKEIDIAIIVPSGKAMDLVDALCIGQRCNLKRYSGIKLRDSSANQKKNQNLNLNVHLFPSDFLNINEKEVASSLSNYQKKMKFIVLFDSNIDVNHPGVSKLSHFNTKFFQLMPIYSVEHIINYYQTKTSSRDIEGFIRPVTAAIVAMRDRVGQLPSNLKPAYSKNLSYIREYLANPLYVKWPLPDLPPIGNFTSKDVERSLLTEVKFNFDNEEILKEEEENRPSVQDSLNTNFGGKTKMIGHIIQPRFSRKNTKLRNYYEKKRLEKDYLMNPLNKDYENLTGISKQINQNEVLTHTLIYHFDATIKMTIGMNEQVQSFNDFSDTRMKSFQIMIDTYEKFDREYKEKENKLSDINSNIDDITNATEKVKTEIKDYELQISGFETSAETANEERKKFVANDIAKYQLLEELSKLEQKLESNNNENKYMSEEIQRAEKSIADSEDILQKQTDENAKLLAKIEELKRDTSAVDIESAKLDRLKDELAHYEKKSKETKQKMESMMSSLRELGKRSRHSNYLSRKL